MTIFQRMSDTSGESLEDIFEKAIEESIDDNPLNLAEDVVKEIKAKKRAKLIAEKERRIDMLMGELGKELEELEELKNEG